jgi:NAD(P)-dependent dehydrogenase (short-subunit alcohol dehydrogenase family)
MIMTLADEFRGNRVLVTGGTRGIGAAIAERFAAAGASVAITARSLPGGSASPGVVGIEADLGTVAGVAAVVSRIESDWGGVDVLINNLGATDTPPHVRSPDALRHSCRASPIAVGRDWQRQETAVPSGLRRA